MSLGKKYGGIRTVEDIRERCFVDEESGCWHWRGGGKVSGSPSMWLPDLGRSSTMSQALCITTKGRPLKENEYFRWKCKTPYCGNPEHNKCVTLSTLRKEQAGKRVSAYRSKISKTMRDRSVITDEQIAELRESSDTAAELAKRYGISRSYVNKLRASVRRLPLDVAPNASVFHWRP